MTHSCRQSTVFSGSRISQLNGNKPFQGVGVGWDVVTGEGTARAGRNHLSVDAALRGRGAKR
jgi:hypothetical protein